MKCVQATKVYGLVLEVCIPIYHLEVRRSHSHRFRPCSLDGIYDVSRSTSEKTRDYEYDAKQIVETYEFQETISQP